MRTAKISKSARSKKKTPKKKKINKISHLKKIALSLGIGTPLLAALLGGGYLHHRTRSKPLASKEEKKDEKVFARILSKQLSEGNLTDLHLPSDLNDPKRVAHNNNLRDRRLVLTDNVNEIYHFEFALANFHFYYMQLQNFRGGVNVRDIFNRVKISFNSLLQVTKMEIEFQDQIKYFDTPVTAKNLNDVFNVCQQLEYGFSYIFHMRYGFFPFPDKFNDNMTYEAYIAYQML